MTLIELLFLAAMIALGVLFAKAMYPLGILPAVFGFALGVAIIPSLWLAYDRYKRWLYVGAKGMPDCTCGSSVFSYERVGTETHLLCQKCRVRYQKEGPLVWVFGGEERKLYSQLKKHRGWVNSQ